MDDRALRVGVLPARGALTRLCPGRPVIIVTTTGTASRPIAGPSRRRVSPRTRWTRREAGSSGSRGAPRGYFMKAPRSCRCRVPLPGLEKVAGAEATFAGLAARGITSAGVVLQTDGEGPAGDSGAYDLPFFCRWRWNRYRSTFTAF